jgi:hypothetical protein
VRRAQGGGGTANRPSLADALRYAAERAIRAPSVHNTQPWHLVLRRDTALELWSDPSRRLEVLDPRGRQLMLSCGCALFNARAALGALGYDATVERFPDPAQPDLLARLTVPAAQPTWCAIGVLDEAIDWRRTNRRAFLDRNVTPDVIYDLQQIATDEGAVLVPITDAADVAALAQLSQQADELESSDPQYRSEVRAWTTDDPRRLDGVQVASIPYREPGTPSGDPIPVRGFDTFGLGWLPSSSGSGAGQCLLLIGTVDDTPLAWLRAGEAIERVWLELTRLNYSAGPLPQVVEVAQTNEQLRSLLGLSIYPHLLLRVGRAADMEPSRRRPAHEVITRID